VRGRADIRAGGGACGSASIMGDSPKQSGDSGAPHATDGAAAGNGTAPAATTNGGAAPAVAGGAAPLTSSNGTGVGDVGLQIDTGAPGAPSGAADGGGEMKRGSSGGSDVDAAEMLDQFDAGFDGLSFDGDMFMQPGLSNPAPNLEVCACAVCRGVVP